MAGLIGSDGRAGVYWRGSDGYVYTKNNLGQTMNAGVGVGVLKPGDQTFGGLKYREIAAPQAAPVQNQAPAPVNPNGGGGGGTATPKVDKSNDIALQLAGLGAVDTQTNAGLGSIDAALAKLTGQYDTEAASNEGTYKVQSDTNQTNLQKNKQTSLVNAAQGRQGLLGTLSSIGALSGSGIDLANNAVQKGANEDLAGAADNYGTNQSGLDTAIGTFRQEDKMRRDNANTSGENARTNVRGDAAKSRMSFYSNLANDYAAMGDENAAKDYTGRAAALYPEMAKANVPNSNIGYSGAAFTPGTLQNYIAGADSTQVQATPASPGGLPGLIAAPTKKKQLQVV